jgi:hypothetical protein
VGHQHIYNTEGNNTSYKSLHSRVNDAAIKIEAVDGGHGSHPVDYI